MSSNQSLKSDAIKLDVEHLQKKFDINGSSLTVFDDLTFAVEQGEFFCILGPSGCGKSTLLRLIAGLDQATSGELIFHNNISNLTPSIGMVFQEQALFPWMTVSKNIAFLLENNPSISSSELSSLVTSTIEDIGLTPFTNYYPHQLSGGMRQRVAIGRSIANKPRLLLMDEPFVFLDYQTRLSLQKLLMNLWQSLGVTIIFVTHDIDEAVTLADRVLVMSSQPGKIKGIVDVDLNRPRDLFDIKRQDAFVKIVGNVTDMIRDEYES